MAKKKQKTDAYFDQPGLFDIIRDPMDELPVHPSIEDFVVTAAEKKESDTKKENHTIDEELKIHSQKDDAILFMSFGSGSSGNCSFIGDLSHGGFLVDAGIDIKTVSEALLRVGISMEQVRGICLTHDHNDHVRFVYSFVRKYPHMRIYCTPKVLSGILRRHNISRRIRDYHKPIYKEFPFGIDRLDCFEITAFDVSHDGSDNCGFFIRHGNGTFTIATDLGCITPRVDYYMKKANFIMIESNYDAIMLKNGRYPVYLKARIAAQNGHLDNELTASFLNTILTKQLSNIFLCHLSRDNNRPDIAFSCVMGALSNHDDILSGKYPLPQINVLPRYECSTLFTLRNNLKTNL